MRRPVRLALILSTLAGAAQAATVHVEDGRNIPRHSCSYSCYHTVDPILLDMDADGTDDIWMRGYSYSSSDSTSSGLHVQGRNGSKIESGAMHGLGDLIGSSLVYQDSVSPVGYSYRRRRFGRSTRTFGGTWGDGTGDVRQGFLGVLLSGGSYGWLELAINGYGVGQLVAWGYEREPGLGIAAGAAQTYVAPLPTAAAASAVPLPASGVLLAGALGGLLLRRKSRA